MVKGDLKTWCKKVSVNRDRKIVYIPVPKNATSTQKHLLKQEGFTYVLFDSVEEIFQDCYTFTTLRNPLDRYVPAYLTASGRYFKVEEQEGHILSEEEHWKRFVDLIPGESAGIWNEHVAPQYYFFSRSDRTRLKIDRFLLFENFEEEWKQLCVVLGMTFKMCHLNSSPPGLKAFLSERLLKDKELIDKINSFYWEDWQQYNKIKGGVRSWLETLV